MAPPRRAEALRLWVLVRVVSSRTAIDGTVICNFLLCFDTLSFYSHMLKYFNVFNALSMANVCRYRDIKFLNKMCLFSAICLISGNNVKLLFTMLCCVLNVYCIVLKR